MEDGNWYGFSRTEWSKKKVKHLDKPELFWAQYYNNVNAGNEKRVGNDCFMYLQPSALENRNGKWYYGDKELKLNCGMDLAFTEGSGTKRLKRDFTAIAVIGRDADGYWYVLDLERFQTDRAEVYYKKLIELHNYWGFRECTIETNAGGKIVANFIQDQIRTEGMTLVINHQHKNQTSGSKQERNEQLIEPLYRNKFVYHKKAGYTRLLEEELRLSKPPHDDLTDALYIAISTSKSAVKPKYVTSGRRNTVVQAGSRFLSRTRRRA